MHDTATFWAEHHYKWAREVQHTFLLKASKFLLAKPLAFTLLEAATKIHLMNGNKSQELTDTGKMDIGQTSEK